VPWQDARLLAEVLEHVRQEYVERISDQELIEAAIRGMIATSIRTPRSSIPEQFDEIRISTTANIPASASKSRWRNGVGQGRQSDRGHARVPAGVLAGDRILAVD
jgi:carboxyl-terminal processing protease